VNLLGAIEGDDDIIEQGGDIFCTFVQKKAGREKGEMDILVAKEVAESGEIVVQQRFTAGKNDLSNAQLFERCAMTFHILHTDLIIGFALPDVAHDTAAVTATVGVQNEDGQSREPSWER
jgi:hypothetical protein